MTYDLYIGARTYSSWSLRGWLMIAKFNLPAKVHMVDLYGSDMARDLAHLAPARLVPVLRTPEGDAVQDTLAIAETLAERHPKAGLWPADASARMLARWLVAEMHSGFGNLRNDCPMNLAHRWVGFEPSVGVLDDLKWIEELWAAARKKFGGDGPWLFGEYSLADVFYAPVAARIACYELPVSKAAQAYVQAHLNDPAFREWRAEGAKQIILPKPYQMPLETAPWPVAD
ncbi:glutathione S-transferase [Actibacterium pelagium]|uniref:Glutathione S-transferase n=1 Tax=Actibacterium pelagium TaxID=2029103 RepID=A0A917AAA6_9RHOB|nr:glutathione S-transferase [Actibacterium pelagium]GGE37642.1 glutathione S-transferase [Actibacterium pelagium]